MRKCRLWIGCIAWLCLSAGCSSGGGQEDEAERRFLDQCKREGVYTKARQKVIDTVGRMLQSIGYQNITILSPED
ncbi:hypothetical protein QUW47_07255 [Phocaeicola barnesiae]|uniref:hypothetical protein n=1 Tax=Phocaeicola barnesiae TaxID=376804 RepID=UPI0025A401DA|nr:hypothetical protein [Phocaeicola barnesiae]MDM8241684.1 hypothetical protein [Phocaeicola barnesiae]